MRSPLPDYLTEVMASVADDRSGAVADYIEALAEADPDRLAVAIATVDGSVYAVGDTDVAFSIQSISKPFAYALAIADSGLDEVIRRIDVEPSGEAFNEISLEPGTGRPRNPMINAGAITAHTLVAPGPDVDGRLERIVEAFSALAGRPLSVDERVAAGELADAHRNLAIAHMLASLDMLPGDPTEAVEGYVRQCAISVTVADLALMAATLANGGVQPRTRERLMGPRCVRQVLSVMGTCGMYDAAGDWVTTVGIPAKSGVSGGIIGALPGQVGIAVFSPRLDEHGNSVRGVAMCERMSRDMQLHMMDLPNVAGAAVSRRTTRIEGVDVTVFELRGSVQFTGGERLVREVTEAVAPGTRVVIDLTSTSSISDVATRMMRETVARLRADQTAVVVVDPDGVFDLGDAPDHDRPEVVGDCTALEQAFLD